MTVASLLGSLLLALLWAPPAYCGGITFPATVEVDLVFPRNDTYAPSVLFPVVFAFQNASLVPSLDPGFDLIIWRGDNTSDPYRPDLSLAATNFTNNETTYVYTYVTNINTTSSGAPAPYLLSWAFSAGNCSNTQGTVTLGGGSRNNAVEFTIQSGAQEPDLSSSAAASCADASHFAFNVTEVLDVPDPSQYDGHNTCAVFSDTQPLVPGNPCAAVNVAPAAKNSISAALTATACAAPTPVVSCPPKNAASRGLNSHPMAVMGGLVAAVVAVGSL